MRPPKYTKEDLERYGPIWEKGFVYHIQDDPLEVDIWVYVEDFLGGAFPVKTVIIKGEATDQIGDRWSTELNMNLVDSITKLGPLEDFPEYLL